MYKYTIEGFKYNIMENFKNFYSQKTGETFSKYNVVLFVGDYNPITYDEYSRITQFVNDVIKGPEYTKLFEDNVDIGLIMDADKDEENFTIEKKSNLSFDERNFITTKLFGLKSIPIDLATLELAQQIASSDDFKGQNANKLNEILSKINEDMKKVFHKCNILIVLRNKDSNLKDSFKMIKGTYETDLNTESKVDLVFFNHKPHVPKSISLPCVGEIIKAIVLMNAEKPEPAELKTFAAKHGLVEYVDDIRRIHFKTGGEKYNLAFELVFPPMNLFAGQDDVSKQANILFVMDLLKQMYLKISA
jgi:hypothetical protein